MGVETTSREFHSAIGCNVYISEGRDKALIGKLEAAAQATPGVALVNVFQDEPYHRTGFTLVSGQPDRLTEAVVRLSRAALQLLDLRRHDASHPRLGVVDHIALHPLGGLAPAAATQYGGSPAAAGLIPNTVWVPPPPGSTPLAVAATCANLIARQLSPPQAEEEEEEAVAVAEAGTERGGARGVGSSSSTTTSSSGSSSSSSGSSSSRGVATTVAGGQEEEVPALPVYFYGHAHPSRRGLADIRRKLGYFRRSPEGGWRGGLEQQQLPAGNDLSAFPPDLGPATASARWGVVTIGATPWVGNYNVPLSGVDMATARKLAKAISERGGGLPGVQAMALQHADGLVEVACNLLDAAAAPPGTLQARLEGIAGAWGLDASQVRPGYQTNRSPEELVRAAVAALRE
ncbi:hypothetical protein CHLRE_06g267000v5 [Chlamydomonas reinhardtii]|uniref:Formiminotransferase N-terminal subdomain domain-containing protein n=1 Tax=Chlamydomonas reinhardtii TaxID=3055 RepID=A0A2K3DN18_CHLRE|nr:uncharacterized protein CHLRE_06g267000v5 [Chlamydomonas reinhardtii]PNW81936.1 hypothetical protein CHLRE_06g267000v5 [Chlamydomonas reinhardtii]